jgi:hypothetical protein
VKIAIPDSIDHIVWVDWHAAFQELPLLDVASKPVGQIFPLWK